MKQDVDDKYPTTLSHTIKVSISVRMYSLVLNSDVSSNGI